MLDHSQPYVVYFSNKIYLRNEFHFSEIYQLGHVQIEWNPNVYTLVATQFRLHFDKYQKIKFISYIYIGFNQNLDENLYISTKIEIIKQGQCPIRL